MNKASEGKTENYEVSQERFVLQQTTKTWSPTLPPIKNCQIQLSRDTQQRAATRSMGAN